MPDSADNGLIRVNFSMRGFAKVVNTQTLSPYTPAPVALESFGRFLASLQLQPDNIATFQSLPEFRGIDYAGYIIEKERLDPSTGTWIRIEEYRVIGSQASSYTDTRVAYGATYRYRIRTVIKCTFYTTPDPTAPNPLQELATVLQTALQASANANLPLLQRLISAGLQSKSDVNNQASVNLTDHVTIAVDANGIPQFRFNIDTALTQATTPSASALTDLQTALATTQPISTTTLQNYVNALNKYVTDKNNEKTYISEYLTSWPSRNWQYVVIKNNRLPLAPQAISVVPSSPGSTISIYWLPPPDEHRDLLSFTVYRRNALGDPWAIIADNIALTANFYKDRDVRLGQKYIYAITSTNRHGYKSFLSTQVQAELNPSFKFEQKERGLVWISGPGARPDEPNTIFAAFYDMSEQLIAYNNVTIAPAKQYNDTNTSILLRFRSLDTQEKQEVVVNLQNIKRN